MQTFQYHHFHAQRRLQILPGLNALGAKGWDVVCREPDDVGTDGYSYLLKRVTESAPPEIRYSVTGPAPERLSIVAANGDQPALPDADAAAAERTIHRLVPRDPPDTRIPWATQTLGLDVRFDEASGNYIVDGQTVSREVARYAEKHGCLPADKVSATAH